MTDNPKKIALAAQTRLEAIEELAPRFFREVLDLDYAECLITDESDLFDFTEAVSDDHETEVAAMLDRVCAHYLIDARRADSTRIVALLEFLSSHGVTG